MSQAQKRINTLATFCQRIGLTQEETQNILPGEEVMKWSADDYAHFIDLVLTKLEQK